MSRGYELPVLEKEDDRFDRWRLASEIWSIVGEAPLDWSIRVGVYGKWGEGKTSVLKFLQAIAEEEGHIVVWFNPWAIRDKDELWSTFAAQIFSTLGEAGIEIKGSKTIKAKQWVKKGIDPLKRISEFHSTTKAVVGGALSILSNFLDIDGEAFKAVKDGLGKRRLVVMIDDLDRSNPKLLPELLLSLREVLDLPRMSFVLAFDVDIVAGALASEYSAWGRGEEFLEKIIDFPIVLPTASDEQIRGLLEYEINNNFPFVNKEAVKNLFDSLPRNPRKLKLLLRYLWALKKQIERHDDWELDWNTIILWQLLKIESAHVARLFSESKESIDILSTWRFYLRSGEQEESKEHKIILDEVKSILSQANIVENDSRYKRILKLVMLIGEKNSVDSPDNLMYQINLLDRPHSITWKEFDKLYALWKSHKDLEKINEWVINHASNVSTNAEAVSSEVWLSAIGFRNRYLEEAASADTLEKHQSVMEDVSSVRMLIESLFINGLSCVGSAYFRTPKNFGLLLAQVNTWLHFRKNEADQLERNSEEETLIKLAQYSKEDPGGYMGVLAPWQEGDFPWEDHGKLIDDLRKKLVDIAEPHLAGKIIGHFKNRGGISSLWGHDTNIEQKYVLFNINGPLWQGEKLQQLIDVFDDAKINSITHNNVYEFVRMLSYGIKESIGVSNKREDLEAIIKNNELAEAIWNALISRPIQYRGHSKVREIRSQFIAISGREEHFPLPHWLEEEKKVIE